MEKSLSKYSFLKDVFISSLGAYGGPEAHYGVFIDQLVVKKGYLSEDELVELIALCSILPGPTSTQTIVSIGHKVGGPILAFLTMVVWGLPVITVMILLSFLYSLLSAANLSSEILSFIGPMAVGFIVLAAWRIGKKVVVDKITFLLLILSGITTYYIQSPWVFPLLLLFGGFISVISSNEKSIWNRVSISPPWRYFLFFLLFAIGGVALTILSDFHLITLFESFYRYGYLVFGGGQVVVPVMHSELVELNRYMSNSEFLTGYGLVQGLPGPMFSFAAYAGGMAARDGGVLYQIIGGVIGGIGIFLPGVLLIYFIYPVWERFKQIRGIKISLKGINGVAGGMIGAAAIILMERNGFQPSYLVATILTVVLLATKKVPAPLVVVLAIVSGFLFS